MFLTILRKTFDNCNININTDINSGILLLDYNFQFIQTLTNFLYNCLGYHYKLLESKRD